MSDNMTPVAVQQVIGIATYARWPSAPRRLRVCISGQTPVSAAYFPNTLPDGRTLTPVRVPPIDVAASNCEIAVIGTMAPADRSMIIRAAGGAEILTITDADPDCEYGAMFCWHQRSGMLSFDLNIAAVTRSHVRVDPRVLAIGRRGARAS